VTPLGGGGGGRAEEVPELTSNASNSDNETDVSTPPPRFRTNDEGRTMPPTEEDAQTMPPEELDELLRTYHNEVLDEIEEADGVVFPDWMRNLDPSVVLEEMVNRLQNALNGAPDGTDEDYEA
jgi:hypothetical protein